MTKAGRRKARASSLLLLARFLRQLLAVLVSFARALLRKTALLMGSEMIVLHVRSRSGLMRMSSLHVAFGGGGVLGGGHGYSFKRVGC